MAVRPGAITARSPRAPASRPTQAVVEEDPQTLMVGAQPNSFKVLASQKIAD